MGTFESINQKLSRKADLKLVLTLPWSQGFFEDFFVRLCQSILRVSRTYVMATDDDNSNSELSSEICHFSNSLVCNYISFSFLAARERQFSLRAELLHQRCAFAAVAAQPPPSFAGYTPVRPCGTAASWRSRLTSVFNFQWWWSVTIIFINAIFFFFFQGAVFLRFKSS